MCVSCTSGCQYDSARQPSGTKPGVWFPIETFLNKAGSGTEAQYHHHSLNPPPSRRKQSSPRWQSRVRSRETTTLCGGDHDAAPRRMNPDDYRYRRSVALYASPFPAWPGHRFRGAMNRQARPRSTQREQDVAKPHSRRPPHRVLLLRHPLDTWAARMVQKRPRTLLSDDTALASLDTCFPPTS